MAKRNQVEVMDGYRERKKYAGTPVGEVVGLLMRTAMVPLEAVDNFIERRVKKVVRRR